MLNKITKFMLAAALTIVMTLGSGVVAEEMGFSASPAVYACGNTSAGGGC